MSAATGLNTADQTDTTGGGTPHMAAADAGAPERPASRWRAMLSSPMTVIAGLGALIIVLIAIIGPLFEPFKPNVGGADVLSGPSANHWLGTDEFGRDTLSRMLDGARISVLIGLFAVAIGVLVGGLLGMLAGLRPGMVSTLIMRAMDVILSFPVLVLATVISGITVGRRIAVGPVVLNEPSILALVIAFIMIPVYARVTRAAVLAESREEYVVAARACGVRSRTLFVSHLLPNIQAPVVVQAAFDIGTAIILEASLSFLGIGVQSPQASWGNILSDGQKQMLLGGWWLIVFPTVAIMASALCFNLLGDGLRDALDPRQLTRAHGRRAARKAMLARRSSRRASGVKS